MTKLIWGSPGERFYEVGVERGVLYPRIGPGVAWSGITAIRESSSGGTPNPYYIDGYKYLNVASASEFIATLEAYSSPSEFGECDGTQEIANGLFVTQQPRRPFGLSYCTLIGNDLDGTDHGYKIHLVYNAMAAPADKEYETLGDSPDVQPLSWSITTKAPHISGRRPTAHLVIDSRTTNPSSLSILEGYLYGSNGVEPRLPTPDELITWFGFQFPANLEVPISFYGEIPVMTWLSSVPAPGADGDAWYVDGDMWVSVNGIWTNFGPMPVPR